MATRLGDTWSAAEVQDPRFLRTFYVVCLAGGFSRAATRLNCTQPAVTYQVRTLEREFGAPLFERGGRRAVLTPAGRRLLEFCQRYFAEYAQVRADALDGAPVRAEPLRVASVSGFGRYVLFPALARLLTPHADGAPKHRARRVRRLTSDGQPVSTAPRSAGRLSGARLDLRFRTAQEVLRQVEDGDVDLGVVYLTKVSNYLTFRPLYDEELVLIASPAFVRTELARRDLSRLSSLESLPFVTYLEGDYVFGRWFAAFYDAQPAVTTSAHHFDELEEVVETVALGHGASILPLDSALAAVRRRAVRVIRPIPNRRCINRVFAVTRAGAYPRPELEEVFGAVSASR